MSILVYPQIEVFVFRNRHGFEEQLRLDLAEFLMQKMVGDLVINVDPDLCKTTTELVFVPLQRELDEIDTIIMREINGWNMFDRKDNITIKK